MRANYDRAVNVSIKVLQTYEYNQVPIDLNIAISKLKRTIKICSYSKFSKSHGLTIAEICDYFESDLGACAYDRKTERYVIYYNDTKNNEGLERFTIAHELGHMFLKHHNKTNCDIMLRNDILDNEYKVFENEANCFARNILAPHPLVNKVINIHNMDITSVFELTDAFNISYDAAKTRLNFLILDSYRIEQKHIDYFNKYRIIYGLRCQHCKAAIEKKSDFCPICGVRHKYFMKGCDRLFYTDGYELDDKLKLVICPKCYNQEFSNEAVFCRICGSRVYNKCEGIWHDYNQERIQHNCPGNARFCEICGLPTYFANEGFLKPYQTLTHAYSDEKGIIDDPFAEEVQAINVQVLEPNNINDDFPF